jgi:hypothetical protein
MNSHPATEIPDDERDIQPDFAPSLPQSAEMKPNGLETLERLLEGKPLDPILEVRCEHRVVTRLVRWLLETRGYGVTVADKTPLDIHAQGQRVSQSGPFLPT